MKRSGVGQIQVIPESPSSTEEERGNVLSRGNGEEEPAYSVNCCLVYMFLVRQKTRERR
jgi:hypothetical protein